MLLLLPVLLTPLLQLLAVLVAAGRVRADALLPTLVGTMQPDGREMRRDEKR